MRSPNRPHPLTLLAALGMLACAGGASTDSAAPRFSLHIVSGNRQRAPVGQELPNSLVVRVFDSNHHPAKGQLITFRVLTGGGSLYAGSSLTDANGTAQDFWTMGPQPGLAVIEVRAVDPSGDKRSSAKFTALALEAHSPVLAGLGN